MSVVTASYYMKIRLTGIVVLFVACLFLFYRFVIAPRTNQDHVNDQAILANSNSPNLKVATEHAPPIQVSSGRERPLKNMSSDQQLLAVSTAKYKVIDNLKHDEASRSKLLKEDFEDDRSVFSYEIRANDDFTSYLNDVVNEVATQSGVNRNALKAAVSANLPDFDIQPGMKHVVTVAIPADSTKPVVFSRVTLPINTTTGVFSGGGRSSGKVVPGSKGWRYDALQKIDSL